MAVRSISGVLGAAFLMAACQNGPRDFDALFYWEQNDYRRCVWANEDQADKTLRDTIARIESSRVSAEMDLRMANAKKGSLTWEERVEKASQKLAAIEVLNKEYPSRMAAIDTFQSQVNVGYLTCAATHNIAPASLPKAYQPSKPKNP